MNQTVIEVSGLKKQYRSSVGRSLITALDGIDFAVREGELFGLLGPNGAGKTTAVKILLDLTRPNAGEARLNGLPAGPPESRRRVGYLPEGHKIPGYLTARQALWIFGKMSGLDDVTIKRRSLELLEKLRIAQWIDVRVKKYSKGMTQRLGLAIALLHSPHVLLLDEPTDGVAPVGPPALRDILHAGRRVRRSRPRGRSGSAAIRRSAAMKVLMANIEDVMREAAARWTLVAYFFLSTIFILIFASAVNLDIVDGALAGAKLFGKQVEVSGTMSIEKLVMGFESGFSGILYVLCTFLAIFATAHLVPRMQEKGTIDLYLSRPVSRVKLILSRYVAGLILAGSNVLYLIGSIWMIVAWQTHVFHPRFFLACVVILFLIATLLAFAFLIGVITSSTPVSILATYGAFFFGVMLARHARIPP